MELSVKFMGTYRKISDPDGINLQMKGSANVKTAVKKMGEELPRIQEIFTPGDLTAHTLILVNGQEIGVLKGLETKIKDGDEMVIIPVSHGG